MSFLRSKNISPVFLFVVEVDIPEETPNVFPGLLPTHTLLQLRTDQTQR